MRVILTSVRTLRQVQKELRANWTTVRKLLAKLGIKPQRAGRIVLITDEEFQLIKTAHKEISKPRKRLLFLKRR